MAKSLNDKIKEILKMAEETGTEQDFFFSTTYRRYLKQLEILNKLENELGSEPVLITKEYVRDRKNLYTHPAITEYNKTADAANRTVLALLKIMTTYEEHSMEMQTAGEDEW